MAWLGERTTVRYRGRDRVTSLKLNIV